MAGLYRKRWTLKIAFEELEAPLNSEINTLGYPKAALFAFCLALVAYNVLSTVKAALHRSHRPGGRHGGVGLRSGRGSGGHLPGMTIAVPKNEWVVFHGMSPRTLCPFLKFLAGAVRLWEFRKQPRGPKKPPPSDKTGPRIKHVAPARLLEKQKTKPQKRQN